MREAIILKTTEHRDTIGRRQTSKETMDFRWGLRQQDAFEKVKKAILENITTGGNDSLQYHLATDASKTIWTITQIRSLVPRI